MTGFIARTESGAVYRRKPGNSGVRYRSSRGGPEQYFHNAILKIIPLEVFATWDHIDWGFIHDAPHADLPATDARLYVGTLNEWRISTPIKQLLRF